MQSRARQCLRRLVSRVGVVAGAFPSANLGLGYCIQYGSRIF
jgi:hypothetical protein